MLSNFAGFVKRYKNEIILAVVVSLISLLSFAVGYLAGNYRSQQDIKFIQNSSS
jgi:uncharacterized membrane protein